MASNPARSAVQRALEEIARLDRHRLKSGRRARRLAERIERGAFAVDGMDPGFFRQPQAERAEARKKIADSPCASECGADFFGQRHFAGLGRLQKAAGWQCDIGMAHAQQRRAPFDD